MQKFIHTGQEIISDNEVSQHLIKSPNDTWVPVTRACSVLRLRMEERTPIWRVAANILNKQRGQQTRGGPPAWRLGEVLITPHSKNVSCYVILARRDASSGDKTIRR